MSKSISGSYDYNFEYKKATSYTKSAISENIASLDFSDRQDFEDATRGFIAELEDKKICAADGKVVWDLYKYDFLKGDAPDTVNPSLWRQEQLNTVNGLFEITKGIYQIRGYDISNMTLIEGKTGWILIDPLLSNETAAACLSLANKHLGERPVKAVIYTHSHADHFGGVCGVINEEDVIAGKVEIVAPEGFMEYAISENLMAGNAMSRRAVYQFGSTLDKGCCGHVGAGLGSTTSSGTMSLIPPTDTVRVTGETRILDGVEIVFQMANGSEAPSEFVFYFPEFKAMCMSEVTTHVLHNLYTLRGAEVRNALDWSQYIQETVDLFGKDVDVAFASHHWPIWGTDRIIDYLHDQRDVYRFIHDETLRLANHGLTPKEISEVIKLPEELEKNFATRGYYGTLKHNAKAVYQFYLGWFDANPANLDPLPPVDAGAKYVEFMGGAEELLEKARKSFEKGDYRWVAEVVNHLVFSDPSNIEAKALQADTLEQLGYQSEAGTWRNFYLTAAQELRHGIKTLGGFNTVNPQMIKAMTVQNLFNYMAVYLNPEKARGVTLQFNLRFSDNNESYSLELNKCVLNSYEKSRFETPDAELQMSKEVFALMLSRTKTVEECIEDKELVCKGRSEAFTELLDYLDMVSPSFPIVTP